MGSLFGGKQTVAPAPAPVDYAAADLAREQAEKADKQRRMAGGRASTMLTGGTGVMDESQTARKKLLGS